MGFDMTIRDSAQIKNKNNKNVKNKKSQRLVGDAHAPSSEQQAALDDIANEHRKAVAAPQNAPLSDAEAKAKPNTEDSEAFAEPVTQRVDSQQSVHSSLWVDADDFLSLITQSGSVYDTLPSREGQFNVFAPGMDGAVLAQASGTSLTSDGLLQYKAPPEPAAAPAQGAAAPQAPAESSVPAKAAASSGSSATPALALLALGGGGGGGGTSTQAVGGTVSDGYIKNASVYVDVNKNGKFDSGTDELVGTTDNTGRFTGTVDTKYATYNLLVVGGIDTSTGLAFNGVMKAPVGYSVVNPLTTLVSYLADAGVANPETKVLSALGLTATMASANASLSSFDPLFYINAGTTNADLAAQVQAVALQVANVIVAGSAAVVGSSTSSNDATKLQAAGNAVLTAFADTIKTGSAFDITDGSTLTTMLSSTTLKTAATASGLGTLDNTLLADKAAAAGTALDAINTVISNAVASSTAGTAAEDLANAVKAQWVAQNISGNAATSLMSTLISGTSSAAYVADYDSALEITSKSSAAPAPQLNPSGPTVTVTDIAGTLVSGTTYTLTGTLSTALTSGQTLRVSYDGGTNWESVASGNISGTTFSLGNKALGAAGLVTMKVVDSAARSGLGFTEDLINPFATVADNVSGTANLSTGSVLFTYTFNESVSGLTTDDFQVTNGTVASVTGSGTTWTVGVTPTAGVASGNITLALPAEKVTDAFGNGNELIASYSQPLDTLRPTLSVGTAPSTSLAGGGNSLGDTVTLTVTFDEAVNGLVSGANSAVFMVDGAGQSASWSGTNGTNTRTLTFTVASEQAGQLTINESALKTALVAGIVDVAGNAFAYTANAGSIANIDSTALPVVDGNAPILETTTPTTYGVDYGPTSFIAQADGNQITITANEALAVGTATVGNFVLSNGSTVTAVSASSGNIILTLDAPVERSGAPLTLSYSGPSRSLQDLAGNSLEYFDSQPVHVNTATSDPGITVEGSRFVVSDSNGDTNYISLKLVAETNAEILSAILDNANGAVLGATDITGQFNWDHAQWIFDKGTLSEQSEDLLSFVDKTIMVDDSGYALRIYLNEDFFIKYLNNNKFLSLGSGQDAFTFEQGFIRTSDSQTSTTTNFSGLFDATDSYLEYPASLSVVTLPQEKVYADQIQVLVGSDEVTFNLGDIVSTAPYIKVNPIGASAMSMNISGLESLYDNDTWDIELNAPGNAVFNYNTNGADGGVLTNEGRIWNYNDLEVMVWLEGGSADSWGVDSPKIDNLYLINADVGYFKVVYDGATNASLVFADTQEESSNANQVIFQGAQLSTDSHLKISGFHYGLDYLVATELDTAISEDSVSLNFDLGLGEVEVSYNGYLLITLQNVIGMTQDPTVSGLFLV